MCRPIQTSADHATAMTPWIHANNGTRPHSALRGKSLLRWIAASSNADTATDSRQSNPEAGFVEAGAVKLREATAAGGSGLTAPAPTQAKSDAGWDTLLGNDIRWVGSGSSAFARLKHLAMISGSLCGHLSVPVASEHHKTQANEPCQAGAVLELGGTACLAAELHAVQGRSAAGLQVRLIPHPIAPRLA